MLINNNFLGWRASSHDANQYVKSIKLFLSSDEKFENFRQPNSSYNTILEHVNQQEGLKYLEAIKKQPQSFLNNIHNFKRNDCVGNPIVYYFEDFGFINPTTLRYIKFAGDISNHFGNLNNFNLIEIGGGYGGLVRILSEIFKFKSITMVDLPEALELQKKYLNKFDITIEKKTVEDDFNIEENTLVISNYAWCECDKETRKKYLDKIISKCKYSFMAIHDVDVQILIDEIKQQDLNAIFLKDVIHNTPIYIKK